MYKKIKNSSFMNLIWFILCALPIILLIIFTSQYTFDNKTYNATYKNIINENNLSTQNTGIDIKSSNSFNFRTRRGIALITFNINELNDDFYFYFTFNSNNNTNIINLNGISLDYNTTNELLGTLTQYTNDFNYYLFKKSNFSQINFDNYTTLTFIFTSDISNTYPIELKVYNYNNIILFDNVSNIINNNESTFENYLNSIYTTIQSNGFISNAFLNLSQLFGVNNTYYALACYYIEYLLVIVLLHLAFDILYMLPNICHKFCEKIGGERD